MVMLRLAGLAFLVVGFTILNATVGVLVSAGVGCVTLGGVVYALAPGVIDLYNTLRARRLRWLIRG